jgi:hypothetical protein
MKTNRISHLIFAAIIIFTGINCSKPVSGNASDCEVKKIGDFCIVNFAPDDYIITVVGLNITDTIKIGQRKCYKDLAEGPVSFVLNKITTVIKNGHTERVSLASGFISGFVEACKTKNANLGKN